MSFQSGLTNLLRAATTMAQLTMDIPGLRNGAAKSYRGICLGTVDYFRRLMTCTNSSSPCVMENWFRQKRRLQCLRFIFRNEIRLMAGSFQRLNRETVFSSIMAVTLCH